MQICNIELNESNSMKVHKSNNKNLEKTNYMNFRIYDIVLTLHYMI